MDGVNNEMSSGGKGCRVYVGNLAWKVKWPDLKDHMRESGGNVVRADVFEDRGGRSQGCGIVEYETPEEAAVAIERMHNSLLKDRNIFVREDREDTGEGGGSRGRPSSGRGTGGGSSRASVNSGYGGRGPYNSYGEGESYGYDNSNAYGGGYNGNSRSDAYGNIGRRAGNRGGYAGSSAYDYGGGGMYGNAGASSLVKDDAIGRQIFVGNLSWNTTWQDLKDLFRDSGEVLRADVFQADGRSKGCGTVLFENAEDAERAVDKLNGYELHSRSIHVRMDQGPSAGGRGRGGGRRY